MDGSQGPAAARVALKEWLALLGESISWLAAQLDVAQPTASRWFHTSRPEEHHREAIAILSGGRVPVLLWRTADEMALVMRMRPVAMPSGAAAGAA